MNLKLPIYVKENEMTQREKHTVSALFEPRGSIFQNGFLSGVLLIFDLPGVVIETGVY